MALLERTPDLPLAQILEHWAGETPSSPFLHFRGESFSYRRVNRESRALAAALSTMGIEPGDRVAVILPGCPEFVVSLFACARLGVVIVPINPKLPEIELRYMLRHSEAVCAVTVENLHGVDYLQLFEDLLPRLPELQYLVTVGDEDLWYDDRIYQFEDLVSSGLDRSIEGEVAEDPDELFAIVYTSGTTGKPKGVELTRRNLLYTAGGTARALAMGPSDRVIGITALFHPFGLGPGVLGTALAGASLVLQEEVEPAGTLDLIEAHGVTVHHGVPMLFAGELREQERRSRDLSSLRVGFMAGSPFGERLFDAVEAALCPRLVGGYSLTETSSTLAMTRPDDPLEKRRFTVGRPLEGTEVKVVGPEGEVLPVESLGEILVRGDGVMKGYYRQPRATEVTQDPEGYFRTGDLGIVDEDGFIHLVGRRQDVIIRGGSNVHPREVEDRLLAHPAVLEAVVVGVQDDLLGEAVCAVLVPMEGAIVTEEEIQDWCSQTLAAYKTPDSIRFVDALPSTGTGKIRRVEIARLLKQESRSPGT
ncbi:MAG: long-chain fatty acid--CoA ligase [Gemmatimonadales bacterium]|nr:MAG: long-chain fatty acid--CoA ligase [Gemmatimonadales bacterium]